MRITDSLNSLHPYASEAFHALSDWLAEDFQHGECPVLIKPFETYRTPDRQATLFARKKTRALPFQSAHQYGLAVDFVPFENGVFTWEADVAVWDYLKDRAHQCGLKNDISWDRAHVWHPLWDEIRSLALRAS